MGSKHLFIVKEIDKRLRRAADLEVSTAIGGGAMLATTPHALDGPEHTLKSGALIVRNIISPAQLVANTDNWNPAGLATAEVIRVSTDASRNLTGIVAPATGFQAVVLANVGAFDLVLKHNVTSTAANRLYCPNDTDVTLQKDSTALLVYDVTTSRWRVIGGGGGGGSTTIIVQEGDSTVEAVAATIDFGHGLDVTSSPAGEANVAVDETELDHATIGGTSPDIAKSIGDDVGDLIGFSAADTPVKIPKAASDGKFLKSLAAGTGGVEWANNPFVEGVSAKASGTGDVTTTGSLQDLTGASLSLAAGTWVIIGIFDVRLNNGGNDKLFEGHLDVNGSDENDIATLLGVGLDDADRHTTAQCWRVTLSGAQTVKLRAKHSGGATGDFTVLGANTTITAVRPGGVGIGYLDSSGHPDRPPASPNTEDDEFEAGSLDAKWTRTTNPNSQTFGDSKMTVCPPNNNSTYYGQSYTPGASTHFQITAKFTGVTLFEATDFIGIIAYGAGGAAAPVAELDFRYDGSFRMHSDAPGASQNITLPGGPAFLQQFYVRLDRDASNVWTPSYSFDGIVYSIYTLAARTDATTITGIGLRFGQTASRVWKYMSIDWFRRTA